MPKPAITAILIEQSHTTTYREQTYLRSMWWMQSFDLEEVRASASAGGIVVSDDDEEEELGSP